MKDKLIIDTDQLKSFDLKFDYPNKDNQKVLDEFMPKFIGRPVIITIEAR